jgi:hypothetical protein
MALSEQFVHLMRAARPKPSGRARTGYSPHPLRHFVRLEPGNEMQSHVDSCGHTGRSHHHAFVDEARFLVDLDTERTQPIVGSPVRCCPFVFE